MKNQEIAKLLNAIADILEIKGVDWKPIAYRKAARNIETLSKDIEIIYEKGGEKAINEIPGVGEGIAEKIIEYLERGKITSYEKLSKTIPKGVVEMMDIQGIGPKKAALLYKKLKLTNIKKLESAIKSQKVKKLRGFGKKSEDEISLGIELYKKRGERKLLGSVLPIANEIKSKLGKLKEVSKIEIAGSIKRKKETIRDIDILVVSSKPTKIMNEFTTMPNVFSVIAKGKTKSSITLKEGINVDLRVVDAKSYGTALNYLTGSKEHNIRLRQIALKKGYKLSEYGLFKGKKFISGKTEKELYQKLGMEYVEPEIRENIGEIELSSKNKLPKLIPYNSIKGDLHMHTKWSDGNFSTEEMIKSAMKLSYEYIAITEHSKSQRVANGLNERKLDKHLKEIEKLRKKYKSIKILKGAEVDILPNGKLDYGNSTLKKLDIVIASIHSRFKSPKQIMTKRILEALSNEHVKVLAHPTGRLINRREPYALDLNKVIKSAKDNNVALEINSHPERLDLNDINIKRAIGNKNKLIINTDSHSIENLKFIELGISQARRGWAEKKDIINTNGWKRFEKFLSN